MPESQAPSTLYLVPISGPVIDAMELKPKEDGVTLGRSDTCELILPPQYAEKVSRTHARFNFDGTQWRIADLNSRWGTFVNGVKLPPTGEIPLSEGDLIRVTPWTFSLSRNARRKGMQTTDDAGQTMVRAVSVDAARGMRDDMLALLLESAAAIHSAETEQQLAETVMDAAARGTGLSNAALLRPIDATGRIEIISSRLGGKDGNEPVTFSRSLINTASTGQVAEISGFGSMDNISHSIVQMQITAALCVPLMLGGSPAAYLYLDSRGTLAQGLRANASAFCVTLGRMASLALANLKRVDMERRTAKIEAELHAAALAQKWILPARDNQCGLFHALGESRPGQYVGGDFFDIIRLADDKLAIAVGDVSGKGIAASVLMTATQGFLHAALQQHGDPARAVTSVNQFVNPRRPENKFVTAWVGVFDLAKRQLSYVDAGHSYATLMSSDGSFTPLDEGGGLPIGVMEDSEYASTVVSLPESGRVMVVSDGIVEQPGLNASGHGGTKRVQFEMDGVRMSLSTPVADADPVAALFSAVFTHAGGEQLADDATAVLVSW